MNKNFTFGSIGYYIYTVQLAIPGLASLLNNPASYYNIAGSFISPFALKTQLYNIHPPAGYYFIMPKQQL